MKNLLKAASAQVKNRYLRRALQGLLALLLLLALTSWAILPSYVKRIASEQAQQQIGRKLAIGEISFSPFRLALTANDITLYEADQHTPALQARQLVLNLSLASLFRQALVIDEVKLQAPSLHIVRTSGAGYGHYNFSDILERIAAMPKSDTPFRFALANLQLADGVIQFDDQVVDQHIKLDALQVGLPFLSNFPAAIDSYVQPMLSARVNGASFELKGRAKPFADSHDAALAIDLEQLELANYMTYVPVPLPVQLQGGKLSTRLDLVFSRKNQQAELLLAGEARLQDVALLDKKAAPLLKLGQLQLQIRQFNVFSGAANLDKLQISAPEVWLDVDQQGKLNWASLAGGTGGKPAPALKPAQAKPALPLISLRELSVQQGQLHVRDAWHAAPAQSVQLDKITLSARQLSSAADAKAAPASLSLNGEHQESLQFEGEVNPLAAAASGKLSLNALPLEAYQAFLNKVLAADLAGQLNFSTQLQLQSGKLQLDAATLRLDDFSLKPKAKGEGGITLKSLALDQLKLNTASHSVTAGKLQLNGLNGDLRRDTQAVLNLQKWQLPPSASTAATPPAPPWKLALDHFGLQGGVFVFTDLSVSPAVTVKADSLTFSADQLSSDLSQASKLTLQTNINRKGKLSVSGAATPQLKNVTLNLNAQSMPVASLSPYFSRYLNVSLTRGLASARGKLNLGNVLGPQPQVAYDGMLSLNDFHVLENGASEDFLEWKSIALEGINARFGGSKPLLEMKKLALNDFYARAILSEKGRLNLQNILVSQAASATEAPVAGATPGDVATVARPDGKRGQPAVTPVIRIAQTVLHGGNINFTDNFIKPNYSANLTGVSGSIGALASDQPQAATLELNGKIDHDAPLLISGSLNPLSASVFLDIKGSASGIELTRLTPYAAKYAGYAIDKGKLSMQASYHIENQQLHAENEIRLDQLSFGERIDSPTATHLPVMLAVALLRDNNGQIAINLPISGSLNDPQFSVGGIVFRVFVNLITKAVTSPFALLGSLFGGGEELAYTEFAPGQAALTPAAIAKLDNLAKALKNRAGLKLDITARVEPASDSDGLRRESLRHKLRELKWKELRKQDRSILLEDVNLDEGDKKKYVEEVYKAEKFSKPRNLIGLAKTLPSAESEQLILSNTAVTPDALRLLAQQRADAVRDYLEQKGEIAKERMFLIAPKMNADGIKDKGVPNRVDFSLK